MKERIDRRSGRASVSAPVTLLCVTCVALACAAPPRPEAPTPAPDGAAADTAVADTGRARMDAGPDSVPVAEPDTANGEAAGGGDEGAAARRGRTEDGAPGDTAGAGAMAGDTAGPERPGLDSVAFVPPAELPVPILPGALLPRTRIVAFYGNPASERMGILGEVPPDEMLARLETEVAAWREADPDIPVTPALQMIAVMATGDPGRDSLYRLRMPDSRIHEVAEWADRVDGLLFLDVQPGLSTVQQELPELRSWLSRPDVHLALDPEWAMPDSTVPGERIGFMTADDINYAIDFLADIVEEYHLPPKVLVVHRFTQSMIRSADAIRRDPRVQVVINMDGWGSPNQKRVAYRDIVAPEADQWTGFKLFFHNDRRGDSVLLTPAEILELDPPPIYIQYQ